MPEVGLGEVGGMGGAGNVVEMAMFGEKYLVERPGFVERASLSVGR